MNKKDIKNFTKLTRSGISLIVLIITIIVVIILASVVILTISKNNPLKSAKEATFKSDVRNFQDELAMYVGNQVLMDYGGTRKKITTSENPKVDEMNNYISSFTKNYEEKLGIEDDELVYFPDKVTADEKKWLDDLGIKPSGYFIPEANEECFKWNGDTITGYYDDKLKEYLKETNGVLKIPKRCKDTGYRALSGISYIENIVMQDGILNLNSQTFRGCQNLKSVYISKTVRSIYDLVFNNCPNLIKIEVDSENLNYSSENGILYDKNKTKLIQAPGAIEICKIPDTVKIIGNYSFESCKNLKEIEIPEGVTHINMYAFDGCKSLTTINLPDTLTKIEYGAFMTVNLTGEIVIPDNVEYIGGNVFNNCKNIEKIIIGSKVKTITGDYYGSRMDVHAFKFCSELKAFEVKNDNIYFSSQDGILYNKDKTKLILAPYGYTVNNLYIPNTVKEIGERAFFACENITGILYIPNGVTTIGFQSFSQIGISGEVNIPPSVTDLKETAFYFSKSIAKINVDENNQNYSSQDGILYNKDKTTLIFAPQNLTIENLTLPNSVKTIEGMSFCECKNITGTLTLNNNLETIKDRAFYGCYNITGDIIIPSNVSTMDGGIFQMCSGIKTIKCRQISKPSGWSNNWNSYCNATVEWGYTGE